MDNGTFENLIEILTIMEQSGEFLMYVYSNNKNYVCGLHTKKTTIVQKTQ